MLIWLAASSLSRGTRLGIVASFAGSQTRVIASMITVATKTHSRVWMIGMVMKTIPRRMSPMISVQRRSSRSATYPASGPSTTAGSTRRKRTPAMAKFWSAYVLSARALAIAVSASSPSQSPRLDSPRPIQSRRNDRIDSTPPRPVATP